MEMIETLLRQHGAELVDQLTRESNLDSDQAGRFVPEAVRDVGSALGSGGLDLGSLLGGDLGSLLSKLDVGALAGRSGLGEADVSGALQALVPMVLGLIQKEGSGLEGLVPSLGGKNLGGLLGKAGKLFGR